MSVFWRATWILFAAHLRRTFLSRRALIAGGLALLPVLASLLVATVSRFERAPPLDAVLHMGWFFQIPVMVLIALLTGSAVVAEEIEDRTITYLFTRPIPRASIVVGRYLATLVLVLVILGIDSGLVLRILSGLKLEDGRTLELPEGFLVRMFWAVLLGGAVYSAVFAALGALVKRAVLVGLAYAFVVEGLLGHLPGQNQKLTIVYYLKSVLLAGDPDLLEHFDQTLAPLELASPSAALGTLLLVLLVGLGLGAWRLARREYVLAA
jgi:ABC-type transport system involved in multi-copper enzyme maturation permease subunit